MGRKSKKTRLELEAPRASLVTVAGTFNGWSEDATPMARGKDGVWRVEVDLAPGRHEYKYLVDGNWCCEMRFDGGVREIHSRRLQRSTPPAAKTTAAAGS
ncbi:MAG: glycogen-binding domain-containing protein [Sandaracinaceae bacterium]|nr:glycogen-binding domain-containing protein [Sandaracinaceae bacterium]